MVRGASTANIDAYKDHAKFATKSNDQIRAVVNRNFFEWNSGVNPVPSVYLYSAQFINYWALL